MPRRRRAVRRKAMLNLALTTGRRWNEYNRLLLSQLTVIGSELSPYGVALQIEFPCTKPNAGHHRIYKN